MASFLPIFNEYFGSRVVLLWFSPYFHFIKLFHTIDKDRIGKAGN
jgi:hypothetical protein